MKKITVSILTTLLMLSMVFSSSVFAAEKEVSAWDSFLGLFGVNASADDVGVEYRGHVQNKGDFPTDGSWIQGPNQLGTVGESLRLEAFWIKLTDAPEGLHIKYEVHVQNIGWMAPVEDGALAGTQGDSLRIEAIKISLVDDAGVASEDYTVTYKGHIQYQGDTAWIASGQQLGTTGSGLRLEALEVKIEKIPSDLTAYEAALAAVTEASYTKASWAAYQAVVAANVVTTDDVQSDVDAATEAIVDAQDDLVTVPVIAGMTASGQKAITITGTELSKLAPANLTVVGNTVTAVVANAEGTSATAILGTDLVPDTNTKVTATIDGTATDYTVKFTVAATKVAIQTATYDDDLKDQKLKLLVNDVEITVDYLVQQGYSVTFKAWNESGTLLTNGTTLLSTTVDANGKLIDTPTIGTYTAQVVIAKGSTIATSEIATIKVANLDNNADAITSYSLTNSTPEGATTTNDFKMNSSTFYVGETGFFDKVVVGYGSAAAELLATYNTLPAFNVETSNAAVISVDSNKQLKANGLGTADITITVGNAKKVVTLTVVGEQRVVTTVAEKTSTTFTYVIGATTPQVMTIVVKDQYGDPMPLVTSAVTFANPSITGLTSSPVTGSAINATDKKGQSTITFTGASVVGETGNVIFRNTKSAVIGSATIVTSNQNVATARKLVFDASSKSSDNTINTDLISKSSITYQVGLFNSNAVQIGTVSNLQGYNVKYNGDIIGIVDGPSSSLPGTPNYSGNYDIATAVSAFNVVPKANGTTTLTVTASIADGGEAVQSATITVINGEIKITNVSWKTTSTVDYKTTINYKNVLDITEAASDDFVNGLTLSTATVYKTRIVDTALDPNVGVIYLDKNTNGIYDGEPTDTKLGTLAITRAITSGTWATLGDVVSGQYVTNANKGSVNFTLTDTVSDPDIIRGTKSVTVDVPGAPAAGAAVTGITTAYANQAAVVQAATTEPGATNWASSNTTVATVNASGVVTPLTAGTTVISYGTSTSGAVNSATLTVTAPTAVAFSNLTANGTANTVSTTELTLTFDVDPVGLTAADITVTGATKGALTGAGTTRTLAISAITVAEGANVTVAIANGANAYTPASRTVAVHKDTTAPTITVLDTSATITGFVSNEALYQGGVALANNADVTSLITTTSTETIVSAVYTTAGNTITVTLSGASVNNDTVVLAAGLTDAAGNAVGAKTVTSDGTNWTLN